MAFLKRKKALSQNPLGKSQKELAEKQKERWKRKNEERRNYQEDEDYQDKQKAGSQSRKELIIIFLNSKINYLTFIIKCTLKYDIYSN